MLYSFKCSNKRLLSDAEAGLLNSAGASAVIPVECGHVNCKKVLDLKIKPEAVPDK